MIVLSLPCGVRASMPISITIKPYLLSGGLRLPSAVCVRRAFGVAFRHWVTPDSRALFVSLSKKKFENYLNIFGECTYTHGGLLKLEIFLFIRNKKQSTL
ncbi:hypothetical protein QVD17_31818 [Tagetes erecta]|uniref:Uncharacterized protein n=1 Tax=Tagetes erecta TaxID=13708 RepID=A0AAD8K444_TARER|nr:hypothetical protein QVD17_31818 [Tagetes erecta]